MEQIDLQEMMSKEILSKKIINSWQLCYQQNVDPLMHKTQDLLSSSELSVKQRKNQELIKVISDETKKLDQLDSLVQPIYILTDDEGIIIWRSGDYQTKGYANSINFKEGTTWTERAAGTNAIGLALRTQKQEFITLKEHYALASKSWSCVAEPIFNEDNQVIGVLDISTYQNDSVKESLFHLQMITQSVSLNLQKLKLKREKQLLQYIRTNRVEDVICDIDFNVIHMAPEYNQDFFIEQNIKEISKNKNDYECKNIYYKKQLIGYSVKKMITMKKVNNTGMESQAPKYQQFLARTIKYAESYLPVHIYGESGSGKEVTARIIHNNSPYKDGPLISLNCAGISEPLLESELFGYAPGAFTGASDGGYQGRIEQANGGTLFLDEIDSMSERMQKLLLRVLEEKIVTPVNGKAKQVDFRIVTASNKKLNECVENQSFREDLFYRIFVCSVNVPSLREREEDLIVLIKNFMSVKKWKIDWDKILFEAVKGYSWPGNIREFNNFLERLYIAYQDERPTYQEICELILMGSISKKNTFASAKVKECSLEEQKINQVLLKQHYHLSKTANELGISRSTLYRKMKKFGIEIK